jgi:xylulokinase
MADDLLMGIDVGTYETKGVLVTPLGKVVATEVKPHKVIFPRAGWAEHDAEGTWWGDVTHVSKALLATQGVTPDQIKGVGISAIGPDVLPMDENFQPLRNGILYGVDTRAVDEIAEMKKGEAAAAERTKVAEAKEASKAALLTKLGITADEAALLLS